MIEAQHLTKRYRSTTAVDDVSFVVGPGRVTGFLGPNGAGKSTTMRMVLGLDTPSPGSVLVNGKPYAQLTDPLRSVGALLDAKAIVGSRSAANHLKWLADSNGLQPTHLTETEKLPALLLVNVYVRGQTLHARGLGQRDRTGDNPGSQYARMLLRLADPERLPRLVAAMTQHAATPPADFADDEFRCGLSTVLDGIACRA